ncbi:MAG: hypothetical protein HKN14_00040 [Marinicaulis sp.]|nr:hypothetical protein [Marinicaulis sp.]NNL89472.1 hypothetical protein [Marinicaulis sp.]
MINQNFFKPVVSFAVALSAVGCTTSPSATRDITFHFDPVAAPAANYQAFVDTAQEECKSRDIRRIDGIGSEYHCRVVLLDRAIAAARDPALQDIHGRRLAAMP